MTFELYRVEAPSSERLGFPVPLEEAVEQVRRRAPREPFGEPLRIVKILYRLDPEEPPGIETRAMRKVWRATVLRFPDVGSVGVYVCKLASQHRFAHAGDWTAPPSADSTAEVIAYITEVAEWQRRQGIIFERTDGAEGLPISEVIVRDRIATRAQAWIWRDYGGVLHASHVHSSCFPLFDPDLPCGVP